MNFELQALLNRFCAREGRHGETYLLEQGIQKGLVKQLMKFFEQFALDVVGEYEDPWEGYSNERNNTIKLANTVKEGIRDRIQEVCK